MFRRITAAVLIVALAAVLTVLAWPQLVGVQYAPLIAQAVSLRAAAAIAAAAVLLLTAILTLSSRRFRRLGASFCVLLLLFIGVNAVVLASRGFGTGVSDPAGPLTVLAWNTLGDAPGSAVIADLAVEVGAEVVSLPETSEATADEVAAIMTGAGLPMTAHTVAFNQIATAKSTSLLISDTLGSYTIDTSRGNTSVVPSVIAVPDDGTGPTIIAAHPVAPIPDYLDAWHDDLRWLAGVCAGDDVIMAGDLNSTLDHYGPLANDAETSIGDCADAALASGSAAVGTWPTWVPPLLGSPIDHVMATTNWRTLDVSVVDDVDRAGSDHRPIVAVLEPVG